MNEARTRDNRAQFHKKHVFKTSDKTEPKSVFGDFYVEETCCMSCGVPQAIAPDLVGWTSEDPQQCYWVKQPLTADELDRAIKIIHAQEIGRHRYSGATRQYYELPAEDCDHLRPDLKLSHIRYVASSGPTPVLSLSTSAESGVFSKLWRRLFRR
jgi:hypothetical protein